MHPSWRDLVIGALAADAAERRRFLSRCGVDGAALALSSAGGPAGELERPLLREDADFDALADGLHHLCAEVEEADAVRLLSVLADAAASDATGGVRPRQGAGRMEALAAHSEVSALAALVVRRLAGRWKGRAVGVDALAAWAAVAARLPERPEPPSAAATWIQLEPDRSPSTPVELERFADWLRLAELLARHDPELLAGLGFPDRHRDVLDTFAAETRTNEPPVEHDLRLQALERLGDLYPACAARATASTLASLDEVLEPVEAAAASPRATFAPRFPVARVLEDLVD